MVMLRLLIRKLVLQKQESLTTLALQYQSLCEVDLTDCESLTNSVCEVFSDGGGCPMLRSLTLDNCEVVQRKCFHDSVKTNGVGLTFASMEMTSAADGPADGGTNLSIVGEIRLVPDLSTKCRILVISYSIDQDDNGTPTTQAGTTS